MVLLCLAEVSLPRVRYGRSCLVGVLLLQVRLHLLRPAELSLLHVGPFSLCLAVVSLVRVYDEWLCLAGVSLSLPRVRLVL
jgi:hypothetical protein